MPEIVLRGWPAIIVAFVSAMLITWYYVPKVILVVRNRHLEDKPGKHKIHNGEVPTLGGIGIFAGFLFGYLMGVDGYISGLSYFTAAALMLFFVGLKDDLVYLNPRKKLVGELGSALIIVLFTDLRFTSLHGFLGITDISALNSYLITVFIMLLIINAVNLIDGIDGLAASVGVIASVTFGSFFYLSGDFGYTIMSVALLGSLLAFLRYNISDGPNKIFMGDTGSLVIGFTLSVFAIHFNETVAAGNSYIALESAPSVTIAILIVPLFDTLRVVILRLHNHASPFVADRRHIHHMMLRAGFTHLQATLWISLFNIFIITVAFLLDGIGIIPLGLLLLTLCGTAAWFLMLAVKRRERAGVKLLA
jgi:UDP-N-acetylmuramyl pentapeptide phosphotransferase/UDP-N-acetylglucosamine-1-phosphate transferase